MPRAPRVAAVMPKSLLLILAALPLLFAALVFGRDQAPRAPEPHAIASTRPVAHAHAHAHHTQSHERPTIDDDDVYDDDDDGDAALLPPPSDEADDVASDATSDEASASVSHHAFASNGESLRMTGRGIRPAGEHRSAADRPPRA